MKVYLVRHGESVGNAAGVHQTADMPLSVQGVQQAEKLAGRFADVVVDKIVASPYLRTKQTAKAIAKVTGVQIELDDRIREIKHPSVLVGKSGNDPESKRISHLISVNKDDPHWHFADEENFHDLKTRTSSFLEQLSRKGEENLIVVSHGHTIRNLVGLMIFGEDFNATQWHDMINHMYLRNTGVTVCDYQTSRGWAVSTFNDIAHLLD